MESKLCQKKFDSATNGSICYFTNEISVQRPTVVLLHGLSSNHTTWEFSAEKLSSLNINIIAPDLRGHGYSDKTRKRKFYKLSLMADDISGILEMEGLKQAHLVGYSWGGYIALEFALRYPTKIASLILISVNHKDPFAYSNLFFFSKIFRAGLIVLGYLLLWHKRSKYHYFSQETAKGYFHSVFSGLATMPLSINMWMLSESLGVNFSGRLAGIKVPTLILYSENDAFIDKRDIDDMHKEIADSEVVLIKNSSHYLAGHYKEKISEIIMAFFKKIL